MVSTSELRVGAREVFKNFRKAIEATSEEMKAKGPKYKMSYWRFGCSFDTMTDYLWLLKKSTDNEDTKLYNEYREFLNGQYNAKWEVRVDPYAQYLKAMIEFNTSCCYDDFSWWGIAYAKALPGSPYHDLFMDLFGAEQTKVFQDTSKAIWEVVHRGNYAAVVAVTPASYPGYNAFKENFNKRPEFHGGSPNAWDRVVADKPAGLKDAYFNSQTAKATVMNVEPRFPNGMFQYDYYWDPTAEGKQITSCPQPPLKTLPKGTSLFETGSAHEGCGLDGNPQTSTHGIGPFQLTLMSGLMLVYSSRMHSWSSEDTKNEYISTASNTKEFFYDWFTLPDVLENATDEKKKEAQLDSLLWHYKGDGAASFLVKERPGTYKDGSLVPMYLKKNNPRVWCGDQGLVLGGLVEYEEAINTPSKDAYIENLITGILDPEGSLFQPSVGENGGSLQPFYPANDNQWGCDFLFCLRDYWSGAGVFWRYLFQTYKSNEKVRSVVKSIVAKNPEMNVIIQSAKSALEAPKTPWGPTSHNYPVWPSPWIENDTDTGDLFKWFNPLATLTSAIYILED